MFIIVTVLTAMVQCYHDPLLLGGGGSFVSWEGFFCVTLGLQWVERVFGEEGFGIL